MTSHTSSLPSPAPSSAPRRTRPHVSRAPYNRPVSVPRVSQRMEFITRAVTLARRTGNTVAVFMSIKNPGHYCIVSNPSVKEVNFLRCIFVTIDTPEFFRSRWAEDNSPFSGR